MKAFENPEIQVKNFETEDIMDNSTPWSQA